MTRLDVVSAFLAFGNASYCAAVGLEDAAVVWSVSVAIYLVRWAWSAGGEARV